MTRKEGYFEFITRCLKDLRTGRLYPAKRDQARITQNLARAGLQGKKSFETVQELVEDYFEGMDEIEAMLVLEHVRITEGGLPDALENLEEWTSLERREYLVIRVMVKLNALKVEKDDYARWVGAQVGERFLNANGGIAVKDEKLMLELDGILESMLGNLG
jgi:hypothetical protein